MARDIKVIVKTLADMAGLNRAFASLRQWGAKHNVLVRGLGLAWRGLFLAATGALAGIRTAGTAALAAVTRSMRAARNAAVGLGVGLAASAREFYTWNREAARAWTMMDGGVAAFMRVRREVSALSAEIGVSKTELGKGWYQALSAGVDQDRLIPFLRTAARVSVADGSTIETAIDGMTTVLNAYHMESSQAADVTDLMFKTVRNGKTTFQELAAYIAQAAPAASSMGVGLDQVLAATATLTKQGVPTATAMVAIRNAILGLNKELGDGWAKTMTLQDALERVARQAGYSGSAIEKAFGRENVAGVMGLVGDNARAAADDLAFMRGSAGGLAEAFAKVDSQTGHWPKAWQTVRLLVSDIGEAVDTGLRPAVDHVTRLLAGVRDGGGFTALAGRLGDALGNAAARLIAGVQTAVDVLSRATLGGVIAGAVGALVDMAVTLLAEGLRGLGVVMRALAKVFAAALAEDVMKIDLPFRNEEKSARAAALRNIDRLSPEQAAAFGVPEEFRKRDTMMSAEQLKERQQRMQAWASGLSLEKAASIATATRDADINAALAQASDSFGAARGRIEGAGSRILGDLSRRTGIDITASYARNLGAAMSAAGPLQGPAAPAFQTPASAPSAPAQPAYTQGAVLAAADGARDAQRDASAEIMAALTGIAQEQRTLREQIKSLRARE